MNDRMLGAIAMIRAPALLMEPLLRQGEENAVVVGITSMVFMAGWICSDTVMRRMRAAGTGKWGRVVLLVQLVGLVLAFIWGFFEATGPPGRDGAFRAGLRDPAPPSSSSTPCYHCTWVEPPLGRQRAPVYICRPSHRALRGGLAFSSHLSVGSRL